MKFRCEREALANALAVAIRASGSRTASSPALSGVRLEAKGDSLTLACTDTDHIITCTIPAQVITNGVSVPRARLLSEIVRSMGDGAIEIEVSGEDVVVRGGRSSFNVPTYNASDFTVLPPAGAADATTDAEEFAAALRQVVRAAFNPDSGGGRRSAGSPMYQGVQISHDVDGIKMYATDGYRLAAKTLPHSSIIGVGEHVIVPGKALGELERILAFTKEKQLTVRWADPIITFISGSVSLTTRTIAGEFPSFQKFFSTEYSNVLVINRELILEALRRAKVMLPGHTGLKLIFGPTGVRIEASDRELGHSVEDLDADYTGNEIRTGFNKDLLIDAIETIDSETVRLAMKDEVTQAVVRPAEGNDYHHFIMPTRH